MARDLLADQGRAMGTRHEFETAGAKAVRPPMGRAEAPGAVRRGETLDAARIRLLRRAIRWEAITRAQHRLAVEALRELQEEAHD